MAASLDRAAFFACARKTPFPNALTPGQVAGLEAILDACPVELGTDALAYCLATAFHETARTMLPIKELGGETYFRRMYDPQGARPAVAKTLGNTVPGDGAKFCGRGYVQLTGRANYRRATGELQNRGYLDRALDLTATPDMAMTPDLAAAIMFLGMTEGWFTGRKLSQFFGPGVSGPIGARAIINGQDRAADIAGYFRGFQTALRAAGHQPGAVAAAIPVGRVETKPLAPPAAPGPAVGRNPGIQIGAGEYAPGAVAVPTQRPGPLSGRQMGEGAAITAAPVTASAKPGFWASALDRLRIRYPKKEG